MKTITDDSAMRLLLTLTPFARQVWDCIPPDNAVGLRKNPVSFEVFIRGMIAAVADLHIGRAPMTPDDEDRERAVCACTKAHEMMAEEGLAEKTPKRDEIIAFALGYCGGLRYVRGGTLNVGQMIVTETPDVEET